MNTPKLLWLAPLSLLCLPSCAAKQVRIATPPIERFQPIAEPGVPKGDTDAEVAGYIVRLIDWGRANAGKLEWLQDWRSEVTD